MEETEGSFEIQPLDCSTKDCEVRALELILLVLVVTDKLEQLGGMSGCLATVVGPQRSMLEGKGEPLWLALLTSIAAELLV